MKQVISFVLLFPLLINALTLHEDTFSFPEGKSIIVRKESRQGMSNNPYVSKLEIRGMRPEERDHCLLWETGFRNPSYSGAAWGLLQTYVPYTNNSQNFYFILAIGMDTIKIIDVNVGQNFNVTESSFRINTESKGLGFHVDLLPQKISDGLTRIEMKGKEHGGSLAYLFNHQANTLSPLFSRWQMIYPALPFELALLLNVPQDNPTAPTVNGTLVKIDEVATVDIRKHFEPPLADYWQAYNDYGPTSTCRTYLMVMGIAEYRLLNTKVKQLNPPPVTRSEPRIVEGVTPIRATSQDEAVRQRKEAINHYLAALPRKGAKEVTPDEIENFYERYKWAFKKVSSEDSEDFTLDEMKDFITEEIQRLRYYGLEELITTPPQVEMVCYKYVPPTLTPEQIAQREWRIANPPKEDIFTEEEMAALFAKPDFEAIANLYERGMAYDWHLDFTEAEQCFLQDGSLKSKLMLGQYYKIGRDGIDKNRWKANGMFNDIFRYVTEEAKSPTPEELCLAARACREILPMGNETAGLDKRAEELFRAAQEQGFAKAAFYRQYYKCIHGSLSVFDRDELRKAADPDKDPEPMGFAAGEDQTHHNGSDFYPQKAENLALLKRGIEAHVPLAEYHVGILFDGGNTGGALKANPERAKFWLTRAVKRGDVLVFKHLTSRPDVCERLGIPAPQGQRWGYGLSIR